MKNFLKVFLIPILLTLFSLIVTVVFFIQERPGEHIFSIFGLALASWVLILLRIFKIKVPDVISYGYYIYIVLAIGLGAGFRFYDSIYIWDSVLHTFAGILVPIIGFYLLVLIKQDTNKAGFILFLFCFSMMTASIWEVIEFTIDNCFGMNTQHNVDLIGDGRSGVYDTMKDTICHLVGTTITCLVYTIWYKKLKPMTERNLKK